MNRIEEYRTIATAISNTMFGDEKTKEMIRDMIINRLVAAYLDKSDEFDGEMIEYLQTKGKRV